MPTLTHEQEEERKFKTIRAWKAYLRILRGKTGSDYEQAEAWAWSQLNDRLRVIPGGAWPGVVCRRR